MTPPQPTAAGDPRQEPFRWARQAAGQACDDFLDPDNAASQRRFAQERGVPRSTLGYWLRRRHAGEPADLDPQTVAFLQSASGERFLRRIVLGAFLVFQQSNAVGVRPIGRFLELAQLDRFVAPSYGALHRLAEQMQQELGVFDDEERPRLAASMPRQAVTLCADENFLGPHPCLVAIEPASNFLLLERYAQRRDAATWTAALRGALQGLPVDVVLLCSDRAKGLVCCAGDGLRVTHSPDLFHQQRDLLRPLLLPLARPVQQAKKDLRDARAETERLDKAHQESLAGPRRGRPVDYFDRILESVRDEAKAKALLTQGEARLEQALTPVRGLSDDYHPFDRQTGRPVEAQEVRRRLEQRVEQLHELVRQADLPEQAAAAVQEARSFVAVMAACVAWFWQAVRQRIEALALSAEGERAVYELLLPGCYWQAAARRARTSEERQRLQGLAQRLQEQAWAAGGALAALAEAEREEVERVARQCAGLFSRSSSCVEGRNGRLSLQHHGHTRLSAARLKALGVVHNYVSRREDGTTAAERFFGSKPRDVFAWLLERMPELPRPAAKRPKQPAPGLARAG